MNNEEDVAQTSLHSDGVHYSNHDETPQRGGGKKMKAGPKTMLAKKVDELVKIFGEQLTKVFKEEIRNVLEDTARRFESRRGPGRPRKTGTAVKAAKKPDRRRGKTNPGR
jgi:hypothetical protein